MRESSCEGRAKRTSQIIVKLRGRQREMQENRLDLEKGQKCEKN